MEKSEQQESTARLLKALAAGAAAAFRPNLMDRPESLKTISAAYLKLRQMIQNQTSQVDVTLLDIGPGSEERQKLLAQQIQEAGIFEDEKILEQAQLVLDNISENDAKALWASEVADPAPQHT